MPCRTDEDQPPVNPVTLTGVADLEAALCGVLTLTDSTGQTNNLLGKVNWTEAGVTRAQVEKWWADHKAADQARLKREQDIKDRDALLASMTPEQRRLLKV
jgi:hypothetical protein